MEGFSVVYSSLQCRSTLATFRPLMNPFNFTVVLCLSIALSESSWGQQHADPTVSKQVAQILKRHKTESDKSMGR